LSVSQCKIASNRNVTYLFHYYSTACDFTLTVASYFDLIFIRRAFSMGRHETVVKKTVYQNLLLWLLIQTIGLGGRCTSSVKNSHVTDDVT